MEKKPGFRDVTPFLRRYLKGQMGQVAALGSCILAGTVLTVESPQLIRAFIDQASSGAEGAALVRTALFFMAIALGSQLASIASAWFSQRVGWRATNALRTELYAHCLSLDMAFHKNHLPGELIERIDGDVNGLMNLFSNFSLRLVGSVLLLAFVLVRLYLENLTMGLAMTAFAVFAAFILFKVSVRAVPYWKASRQKSADYYGFLGERLENREDLKALGAQAHALHKSEALINAWYPVERVASLFGYSMWTSSVLVFAAGSLLSLGLGAFLLGEGMISLGTVYLLYSYMDLICEPLEELREELEDFQKALAGIGRIKELLSTKPVLAYGKEELEEGPIAVEVEGLGFSYAEGEAALKSVSLAIGKGRVLGLAGRTGSGKTTIGRLLLRLYDPGSGSILMNGRPLAAYSRESIRRRIAVVTQEVELFDGTIRDNLSLYDGDMPDGRIHEAFSSLGLGPWLASFPEGLDTRLDPSSEGMSAGQAQLLVFVRVFLRDPGLIILDEASSRLDPATEALLEGAVGALLEGRTALIIAHRLATIERADDIMILEDGEAVEYGPRAELAADPEGTYARLLSVGLEKTAPAEGILA